MGSRRIESARVPGVATKKSARSLDQPAYEPVFFQGSGHVSAATGLKPTDVPEKWTQGELIDANHRQKAGDRRPSRPVPEVPSRDHGAALSVAGARRRPTACARKGTALRTTSKVSARPRGTTTSSMPTGNSDLLSRNASRIKRFIRFRSAACRTRFLEMEIPRRG